MWKAVLACVIAAAGTASAQSMLAGGMCPMVTEGAKLSTTDTPGGVALDFTIPGDPTGLRARVHQMAAAHNQAPGRMTVSGSGSAARDVPIVAAQARAIDTPNGARVVLTADDPAQAQQLRQQMRDKIAACTARAAPGAAAANDPPPMPMGGMCPMMSPDTKVSAVDTKDGVAMTFTTTKDPADLRARVRGMADMHNRMHAGSGSAGGGMGGHMVPSQATAEDIPGGARIVLKPNDPGQLATLRAQARQHAARMQSGECPMMGGSGG